jgi:pimeloyl-ACP methyl ester carboxylesterase
MWQEQIEQLTDFNCLAPDLPGHGHSHDIRWRSFEQTADLVAEIIRKNVPSGRAHVVGLSLGAYVGLTLLTRHPSVVERAVLSGINVLPLPNKWLIDAAAYAIAPLIKTRLFARINAQALNIPADRFETYRQSLQPLSIRSFITASHDASAFSMAANTAEIQTPTLLVAGEREHPLIPASMARLRQVLPNSQARLVKGVGHAWNGERPDLFAATVKAWCAQSELPDELMNLTIQ